MARLLQKHEILPEQMEEQAQDDDCTIDDGAEQLITDCVCICLS